MRSFTCGILLAALAVLHGPGASAAAEPEAAVRFGSSQAATRLRVLGTTDIAAFAPLLEAFAAAVPELRVEYEQWSSNALFVEAAAACGRDAAVADLIVSSAVDQQVRLVNDGCARPHVSVATAALPPEMNWRNELFGVTREPAVIVYNRDAVPEAEAPRSRFDLIDLLRPEHGRYVGRVATYDIESSGLGYLFAFADSQAATTFGSLLEALSRSRAEATCCSREILDGIAEGRYLIAYNVLGSYALDRAASDPRIVVVAPEDYTLVLSRAAMIPRAAENPTGAGLLVDFMLSDPGRAALATTHLLMPDGSDETGGLPEGDASRYRQIRLSPALLLGLDARKRGGVKARGRKDQE